MTRHASGLSGRISTLVFSSLATVLLFSSLATAQTIRGRVTDPDARGVGGAQVIFVRGEAVTATVTTGADGQFGPVTMPAAEYEVLVAKTGLQAPAKKITLTSAAPLDLALPMTLGAVQESVVVSASNIETALSRVTDTVTVIDRSEIELKHLDTVADAIRLVPGYNVVASGGRGAVTSIFPRGGESDYTLVLIDGIPQNAFGGGFDAAHMSTANVERIEVVRGPASAQYGSGAIGGVIHVITRQGGPVQGEASVEAGSLGFVRSGASFSGSQGAWRWGGAVDHQTSDGQTQALAALNSRVSNDDYDRTTGSGSFGWSDRATRAIRVDVRGDRDVRGFPGPFGSDPLHRFFGVDTVSRGRNIGREVGASGNFGSAQTGRHRLQFTWGDLKSHFVSQYGDSDDRTRRTSTRYQFDRELGRMGLSAGWEMQHERVDNTYITGRAHTPVPISRRNHGLFAEARPALGSRAFLTLGLRVERIERTKLEGDGFDSRPAFDSDVVWSANPKASIAILLNGPDDAGWTKLRAGVSTGIKPPTGFEIAYTDNPGLKPERNRSFDLTLEQTLGGAAAVLEGTFFANRYDDLIVTVGSAIRGASRYRTDNIANASSRGLETGLRLQASHGISARLTWTFLHTEVLGVDTLSTLGPGFFKVGDPLVRRPSKQGSAEVAWRSARGSAFLTVGGRSRLLDLEPNYADRTMDNPGYTTVSLGGTLGLGRFLEVYGRAMNVGGTSYEEVLGYPALGRTATVGLRVASRR